MSMIKLRVVFKGNPQCFSQLPISSAFLIAFFEKKHCGFIRHFIIDLTLVQDYSFCRPVSEPSFSLAGFNIEPFPD